MPHFRHYHINITRSQSLIQGPYLLYDWIMVSTTPLTERRNIITQAGEQPVSTEYVYLQGRYQSLPVVELPLTLPLYRAANGRLAVREAGYVTTHNLDSGFFLSGEETSDVQRILHDMLLELARNPEAAIYQELHDSALQTERLLITSDGIVLDGNRRLASMRELYNSDPAGYGKFSRIEAVLLPDGITDTDLELVEAAKQMAPDLKLAYGWIDRRLKLRHHRDDLAIPVDQICKTYRLESEEDLNHEIEELELAEEYLADYLRQPGNYKALDYAEEHFSGLREQTAQQGSDDSRRTWRLVGFAMIKEAGVLSIDPKQYFPFSAPKPPYAPIPVLELYSGENNLLPYTSKLGSGAVFRKSDYKILCDALNQPGESHKIAKHFIQLFDQILAQHEDQPHPIAIINRLKQINSMLGRIELEQFTESQRSELFGQLAETAYQFRYLTKQEDKKAPQPDIATGRTHLSKPIFRMIRKMRLTVKACLARHNPQTKRKS